MDTLPLTSLGPFDSAIKVFFERDFDFKDVSILLTVSHSLDKMHTMMTEAKHYQLDQVVHRTLTNR